MKKLLLLGMLMFSTFVFSQVAVKENVGKLYLRPGTMTEIAKADTAGVITYYMEDLDFTEVLPATNSYTKDQVDALIQSLVSHITVLESKIKGSGGSMSLPTVPVSNNNDVLITYVNARYHPFDYNVVVRPGALYVRGSYFYYVDADGNIRQVYGNSTGKTVPK